MTNDPGFCNLDRSLDVVARDPVYIQKINGRIAEPAP
jgi:hypothetical protein